MRALFEDEIPVDDSNSQSSESYVLADVRVGLDELPRASLRVSPYAAVTNVFDRRYNAAVVVNAFGGRYYEPGPPRSFQVGVSVRWGG